MKQHIKLEEVLESLAESDRRKVAIKSVASLVSRFVKEALKTNEHMETGERKFSFAGSGLVVTWIISSVRFDVSVGAPVYVTCGGNETLCLSKESIPLDQVRLIYASLEAFMEWASEEFGLGYHFHSLTEAVA